RRRSSRRTASGGSRTCFAEGVGPRVAGAAGEGGFEGGGDPNGDADLARLVAAWPTLPAAIRTGILAMIGASGDPHGH
ncbi:MAG: hypothetical protein WD875_17315, partial [Pirellulales bacterium]